MQGAIVPYAPPAGKGFAGLDGDFSGKFYARSIRPTIRLPVTIRDRVRHF